MQASKRTPRARVPRLHNTAFPLADREDISHDVTCMSDQSSTKERRVTTTEARSALMRRVRQGGTDAERVVRRLLWSLGARYRVNVEGLPGRPDIANKTKRRAIFVHGCYWHHHAGCSRASLPKRNRAFWREKFASNRDRDMKKEDELRSAGFDVLVIWECELADEAVLMHRLDKFWNRESE